MFPSQLFTSFDAKKEIHWERKLRVKKLIEEENLNRKNAEIIEKMTFFKNEPQSSYIEITPNIFASYRIHNLNATFLKVFCTFFHKVFEVTWFSMTPRKHFLL